MTGEIPKWCWWLIGGGAYIAVVFPFAMMLGRAIDRSSNGGRGGR